MRGDGRGVLVPPHAQHQKDAATREQRLQCIRQDLRRGLVVRAVEHHGGAVAHDLEPARPAHRGEAPSHRLRGHSDSVRGEQLDQTDRDCRVLRLVPADERALDISVGAVHPVNRQLHASLIVVGYDHPRPALLADHEELRAALQADILQHLQGFCDLRRRYHGHAGLDDPGLLPRNLGEGRSQFQRMIVPDPRDPAGEGRDHVRGVEPAAQPRLHHRQVHPRAREVQKGHQGVGLEETWRPEL